MGERKCRVLLIENCTKGMSPTFSQLAFNANAQVKINLTANINDAKHRLQEGKFDLILLGLNLAECNGIDSFNNIKEIAGDLPIAVILNDDEQHLAEEVLQLGACRTYPAGCVDVEDAIKISVTKEEESTVPAEENQATENEIVEEIEESQEDSDEDAPAIYSFGDIEDNENPPTDLPPEIVEEELIETVTAEAEPVVEQEVPEEICSADNTDTEQAHPTSEQISINEEEIAKIKQDALEKVAAIEAELLEKSEKVTSHEEELKQKNEHIDKKESELKDSLEKTEELQKSLAKIEDEFKKEKDSNEEIKKAFSALEERCKELEAGQAALIEAEHVAIEREKAAKEEAERKVRELESQLASMSSIDEVEKERKKLETLLQESEGSASEIDSLQKKLERAQSESEKLKEEKNKLKVKIESQNQLLLEKDNLADELKKEKTTLHENLTIKAEEIQSRLSDALSNLKDCEWQLKEATEKKELAELELQELENASQDLTKLPAQLDQITIERDKAVNKLNEECKKHTQLEQDFNALKDLVGRIRILEDKADEADKIAEELDRLKTELKTEQIEHRRLDVEISKAAAREEHLLEIKNRNKEIEWRNKELEELVEEYIANQDIEGREKAVLEISRLEELLEKEKEEKEKILTEKEISTKKYLMKFEELNKLYKKEHTERIELIEKIRNGARMKIVKKEIKKNKE